MKLITIGVILIMISLLSSSEVSKVKRQEKLPNIDYLNQGYDIFKGNPNPFDGNPDPGFMNNPIFTFKYSENKVSMDGKMAIPDNVNAIKENSCDLSFSTNEITDEVTNKKSLSVNVEISGGFKGAEFSASTGYKDVKESTEKKNSIFTYNQGMCTNYRVNLDIYDLPELSKNFAKAIKKLPSTYEMAAYINFLKRYGTHFFVELRMGARYGFLNEFKENDWNELKSTGVDVNFAAKYSGLFQVGIKTGVSTNQEKVQKFNEKKTNQRQVSIGSKPPTDSNMSTWAANEITNPMPIFFKLEPISSLIEDSKKREFLNNAIKKDYCENLKADGFLSQCSPPQPKVRTRIQNSCRLCTSCGLSWSVVSGRHDIDSNWRTWNKVFDSSCTGSMDSRETREGVSLCCGEDNEQRQGSCRYCSKCGGKYSFYGGQIKSDSNWTNWSRSFGSDCNGSLTSYSDPINLCCTADETCSLCASCGGKWPHETGRYSADSNWRTFFRIRGESCSGGPESRNYSQGVKLCCQTNTSKKMKKMRK